MQESALRAKASEVYLVEQAIVAAIGAGMPITEACGNMIVDIGGGTTDIAVISLSGIVYSRSVRVAGNEMDEAIIQYIKRKHNLLIGERTAETIKIQLGSAGPLDRPLTMEIKGRNLIEGVPKTITRYGRGNPGSTQRQHRDYHQCHQGGAGAHSPRTVGRHHGPRNCFDRRRRAAEAFRQEAVSGNRASRFRCGGSAFFRCSGNEQDADGSEAVPENLCPVN